MKISLLIPVYNAENYILRCLKSILNQGTEFEYEVILVDDGSTDRSVNLIEDLQKEHPNIILIHQNNSGPGAARNNASNNATGDYLWFIDADDYIEQGVLKKIFHILHTSKPEMLVMGWQRVDSSGAILSQVKYSNEVLNGLSCISKGIFANQVWCKVISSQFIKSKKIFFNTEVLTAEDFDLSFRLFFHAKRVVTVDFIAYNYFYNSMSICNNRSKEHLKKIALDSVTIGLGLEKFIRNVDVEKRERFQKWLSNFWNGLFYSLFKYDYDLYLIKQIVNKMRSENVYPISNYHTNIKKIIFGRIANIQLMFYVLCFVKRSYSKIF